MPRSRSPNGIQADWPLHRAWISFDLSGSSVRKAATVCGALSSSRRATRRKSATVISSTPESLRLDRADVQEERKALQAALSGLGHGILGYRGLAESLDEEAGSLQGLEVPLDRPVLALERDCGPVSLHEVAVPEAVQVRAADDERAVRLVALEAPG